MTTENTPTLLPNASDFNMFQVIARNAQGSGLYGTVGGEAKIFMILLAARELGISPMIALNGGIWNIQGKIEISARLMNSMIRRAGHTMQIMSTDKECIIKAMRADTKEEHTEKFTWAMAEKAGLTKGNVWQKYPEDMLYNRCMSRLARRLFPDVIGTAYVEGEIKEAIEKETSLPIADYELKEDKACMQNVEPFIEKINNDEMGQVSLEVSKLDMDFRKRFFDHISKAWKASTINDIPKDKFEISLRVLGMLETQQKQKEKEVVNA